jgi:aminoglycoside N3'-acetyltransferase
MNNKFSKSDLIQHLKTSGVNEGDTILIRASLKRVGRLEGNFKETFLAALVESVGKDGTIISLGFTPTFKVNIGKPSTKNIFSIKTPPNIGALANIFFNDIRSERSSHPTNSFFAIGKHANFIVKDHDHTSLSYTPIQKLLELDGKMLLLGCAEDSPGFTTVHYAQQVLGLTQKSWISWLSRVYYKDDNRIKLFKKKDIGGCSKGFRNFYADYLEKDLLTVSKVGNAQSILISAKNAYKIELEKLKKDKNAFLCDNPLCFSCRASWRFNISEVPAFIASKIFNLIRRNPL